MSKAGNNSAISSDWEEIRAEIFTPAEIAEVDLMVDIVGEFVKMRKKLGITQKKLEELSGVRQPVIARMEKGDTNPRIGTMLKLLLSCGKTLAVVPLQKRAIKEANLKKGAKKVRNTVYSGGMGYNKGKGHALAASARNKSCF